MCLPAWGTLDVEIQKAWAGHAATGGLAYVYGPPDHELLARARAAGKPALSTLLEPQPRGYFNWKGQSYFVDYPPGSLILLWAAGRSYVALRPELDDERSFNALVNLAPFLGSVATALLLWRWSERRPPPLPRGASGSVASLAFWLNPAMLLAAPLLGYQDPIFAALALGAVLAFQAERLPLAAVLVVVAGLVKPQGVLLVPVLLLALARARPLKRALLACGVALIAAAVILAPWWTSGYLLSALDGARRPLSQTTLAPLGLNVWWIAGWLMQWDQQGPWPLAQIHSLAAFERWAGFDPRLIARLLLLFATLAITAWLARARDSEALRLPLAVILQVHAYALFGTSVHENHAFLAVVLAPLLLGRWPGAWRYLVASSALLFANLFLMVGGLGRGLMRGRTLMALRASTGLDLSVLIALGHVLLFIWLVSECARLPSSRAADSDDVARPAQAE